jgi:hypothetical protein
VPFLLPSRSRLPLAFLLGAALAACGGGGGKSNNAPTPIAARRAQPGDTIYVIEYTVVAPRREVFERFFADSYFPALRRVGSTDTTVARVLRQSRLLAPTRANEDGTLSYLLILDPVVHGASYNISELLRRVYSPAESDRLYRQLTESWARPFVARPYVQPAYPDAGS